MDALLSEIETFMSAHQIAPTRFGHEAIGDKHLVKQLRAGRRVWPETADRIRHFMITYQALAA